MNDRHKNESKTEILIIDEALSVGDKAFRKKCENRVKEIIADGATVLFVSHNTSAIQSFCTEVMYLKKGKLVAKGNVDEIIAKYENEN